AASDTTAHSWDAGCAATDVADRSRVRTGRQRISIVDSEGRVYGSGGIAGAAPVAHRPCQRRRHLALGLAEQRVPDVEHQDHAQLLAVVARLVLDGVVEDPALALAPGLRVVT